MTAVRDAPSFDSPFPEHAWYVRERSSDEQTPECLERILAARNPFP